MEHLGRTGIRVFSKVPIRLLIWAQIQLRQATHLQPGGKVMAFMHKTSSMSQRTFRHPRAVTFGGILLSSLVLMLVLGVSNSHTPKSKKVSAAQTLNQAQTSLAVSLAGYGRPIALSADPTRAGIWFIDSNATTESIFFWNTASSKLSRYPFGQLGNSLPYGMQAGLAVDSTGKVWVGIGTTLLELDPASGAVSRIQIPPVPKDLSLAGGPGGTPGGPPPLFDSHAVQALTVDRSGNIAVAMSFTTSVLRYDPGTKLFSEIALPDGDRANALSSMSDGTVAVATTKINGMDFILPNGTVEHSATASYVVECSGNTCVTSPDGRHLFSVTASSGAASSIGTQTPRELPTSGPRLLLGSTPTLLPDGNVIVPTATGFDIVNIESGLASQYELPAKECSTAGIGAPSAGTVPATAICQETIVDYAVDSSGNIFFTSNFGSPGIYEIKAGSY